MFNNETRKLTHKDYKIEEMSESREADNKSDSDSFKLQGSIHSSRDGLFGLRGGSKSMMSLEEF